MAERTISISGSDAVVRAKERQRMKYGLRQLVIGAGFMVTDSKGRKAQVTARDLALFGGAKVVCRCTTCGREWATVAEMIAGHPSDREMAEAEQTHVWIWWSDELDERGAPIGALSAAPWSTLDGGTK